MAVKRPHSGLAVVQASDKAEELRTPHFCPGGGGGCRRGGEVCGVGGWGSDGKVEWRGWRGGVRLTGIDLMRKMDLRAECASRLAGGTSTGVWEEAGLD